jgi:hypothetical protein
MLAEKPVCPRPQGRTAALLDCLRLKRGGTFSTFAIKVNTCFVEVY